MDFDIFHRGTKALYFWSVSVASLYIGCMGNVHIVALISCQSLISCQYYAINASELGVVLTIRITAILTCVKMAHILYIGNINPGGRVIFSCKKDVNLLNLFIAPKESTTALTYKYTKFHQTLTSV